jgi:hypothetical protein
MTANDADAMHDDEIDQAWKAYAAEQKQPTTKAAN